MGASLQEGFAQCDRETFDGLRTLAAQRALHQFDKIEAGTFRLLAQIGFTVAETIHRSLLPPLLAPAFDGEEIEPTLFQPLRHAGENRREIADIDHCVGRKDEIITLPGLSKRGLDVAENEVVVNAATASRLDHAGRDVDAVQSSATDQILEGISDK